jgi:ammonia channel protein AmtB
VIFGGIIFIFSWMFFNCASEFKIVGFESKDPRLVIKNSVVTMGFSGITFFLMCIFESKTKKGRMTIHEPIPFLNSMFAGLIASSGPCGYVDTIGASAIGVVAGLIYGITTKLIKKFEIDDPLEVS